MAILEECCMASADMQWLIYSGERILAHGHLVLSPTYGEGDILILVWITLVLALALALYFLVCIKSVEPVVGFLPNFH